MHYTVLCSGTSDCRLKKFAIIYEMEEKSMKDTSSDLNSNYHELSYPSESSMQSVKILAQLSLPTLVLNRAYFVCNDSYLVSTPSHFNFIMFFRDKVGFLLTLLSRERTVFPALWPLRTISYNYILEAVSCVIVRYVYISLLV